jgi:formylglycine-generating enzyme required for sulfatase activity
LVLKPLPEAKPVSTGDSKNSRRMSVARWFLVGAGGIALLLAAVFYWFMQTPRLAIAPFAATEAKSNQQAWAGYLGLPVEHTNSIGMKFRLIPPGEFVMGSAPEEIEEALQLVNTSEALSAECIESGAPQHRVRITQPFYLSVHEVTQQDYLAVSGKNPAKFSDGDRFASHPVERVTWNDAAAFCVQLSQREGLRSGSYRLPTEAEWEFACRAGTTTKYVTGDRDEELAAAAWIGNNSDSFTHPVGLRTANPFGLCDMHGNVWEWCQDVWDPAYYQQFAKATATDPQGPLPAADAHRVTRGGSWMWGASRCRSSYRDHSDAMTAIHVIGFRVALSVEAVREARGK